MARYHVKEIQNKTVWEDFILSQNPQSFLQSWNWGETNKLLGKKIFRLGFYKQNELVGVCLVIKETARRGSHFLVPAGPLINWENDELVNTFMETIKNLASTEKVIFVRVRPELKENPQNRNLFAKLGFISAPMHLHAENTWVLNVEPDNQDLLMKMRKTTRYLIRKSLKAGLTIEETIEPAAVGILKKLQDETVKRHKFKGFSVELFKAQMETFGKDRQASIFICRKDKVSVVASIIIFYGNYAYYHHSGSSSRFRKIPASYFTQWKVIEEVKKRGCKYYNFWGVAPADKSKHRFSGVTLFKQGFGGKSVDWLHAHDLPTSQVYWFTYIFESLRRVFRGL